MRILPPDPSVAGFGFSVGAAGPARTITSVLAGGAAAKAGLLAGDAIVRINGISAGELPRNVEQIAQASPSAKVEILRNQKPMVFVLLAETLLK